MDSHSRIRMYGNTRTTADCFWILPEQQYFEFGLERGRGSLTEQRHSSPHYAKRRFREESRKKTFKEEEADLETAVGFLQAARSPMLVRLPCSPLGSSLP